MRQGDIDGIEREAILAERRRCVEAIEALEWEDMQDEQGQPWHAISIDDAIAAIKGEE